MADFILKRAYLFLVWVIQNICTTGQTFSQTAADINRASNVRYRIILEHIRRHEVGEDQKPAVSEQALHSPLGSVGG